MGKGLVNLPEEDRLPALDTIQATVFEQPHKIPLISGAIHIANSINSSIGKITVESFHTRLQDAIDSGKWGLVKQITRFIVCLYPMITGDGYDSGSFKLLKVQLDRAIDLQKSAIPQRSPLAEELYASVMISLPYLCSSIIVSSSSKETKDAIADLISKAREFATIHKEVKYEIDPELLASFIGDNKPYQPLLFIDMLSNAIETFDEKGYELPILIKLPFLLEADSEAIENAVTHSFPAVNFPEADSMPPYSGINYKAPRLYFSAYFPIRGIHTVPQAHTLEALIFRDLTSDVIENMDFNRNEVARQLMTFDLFFEKSSFTEPGISIDRLLNICANEQVENTWKVEDVALESVLDSLFKIPQSQFSGSYYHAILIEACIMAPQAIAPVFGRAIRFLYDNIETLDIELQHRFLDWFSHHLSNFRFLWKWPEWRDNINLPDLHPKKVFMEQLILKELRLSYSQRIRESLQEVPELTKYVPFIPEEPIFKWLEPESEYKEEVGQLVNFLRSDDKEREVIDNLLTTIRDKATETSQTDSTVDPTSILVDIVVSTTCYLGNRSLSHIESWVTRVKDILLDVCSMDPSTAFDSIFEYWIDQPHVALLVTTIFIKSGVLSPKSFIQTLFDYVKGEQVLNKEPEPQQDQNSNLVLDPVTGMPISGQAVESMKPFAEKRKNLWPHWRLLMTSHGWEMLIRLVEYSISEESELASTERDGLFIDILSQFQKLIGQLEEDFREAESAADKAAEEAEANAPQKIRNADDVEPNDEEIVEDDSYVDTNKDTEMANSGEMGNNISNTNTETDPEVEEHNKAVVRSKALARDADSKQWAIWWVKGVSRSLIRHYSELFKKSVENQSVPENVAGEGSFILEILKQINAV